MISDPTLLIPEPTYLGTTLKLTAFSTCCYRFLRYGKEANDGFQAQRSNEEIRCSKTCSEIEAGAQTPVQKAQLIDLCYLRAIQTKKNLKIAGVKLLKVNVINPRNTPSVYLFIWGE